MPADLAQQPNGKLPETLLRPLVNFPQGRLHRVAATAYNAMAMAAFFDMIPLVPISTPDCYRPYEVQERTFRNRYTTSPNGAKVTRTWIGRTWYLKPGNAPSASPGTSNHGIGLAVDVRLQDVRVLPWLLGDGTLGNCRALDFGFTWEGSGNPMNKNHEDWHLRYVSGDSLPPRVVEAIKAFPQLDVR